MQNNKPLTEMTGDELRVEIGYVRLRMQMGNLTYDAAKVEAAPIINEMNSRAKVICKKNNRRFTPVSFAGLMR